MERMKKEEEKKSVASRGMSQAQITAVIGNQAVIQRMNSKKKKIDPDSDFVLNSEDERVDNENEAEAYAKFLEETFFKPEDVPEERCYIPEDKDCYEENREFSRVHIDMQGTRHLDYQEADKQLSKRDATYTGKHEGYTWHHMATKLIGACDMVLVKTDIHNKVPHIGAVHQYERQQHKKGDKKFRYG